MRDLHESQWTYTDAEEATRPLASALCLWLVAMLLSVVIGGAAAAMLAGGLGNVCGLTDAATWTLLWVLWPVCTVASTIGLADNFELI